MESPTELYSPFYSITGDNIMLIEQLVGIICLYGNDIPGSAKNG